MEKSSIADAAWYSLAQSPTMLNVLDTQNGFCCHNMFCGKRKTV